MPSNIAASAGNCALPAGEQALIREFMQALVEEIEVVKRRNVTTVYDGLFVRREGQFYVYTFTTENLLVVAEDAEVRIKVRNIECKGEIISARGNELAVGLERDIGHPIPEATLTTDKSAILESLRKRFEEVLSGQRSIDTRLGQRLFGFSSATARADFGELNLPASDCVLYDEQVAAIRAACGSEVHFIWGPPGTGKTRITIGFLIAALLRRNLRVLVVSHTNVATDHAIASAAKLLVDTEDYQSGKLVRYGNVPNSQLPEMVIPEKIEEQLGKPLKERRAGLQSELGTIESQIRTLHEVESLLLAEKDRLRQLGELESNYQRCATENETANAKARTADAELRAARAKLTEAQAAGALKRLILGLDPVKAQATINRLEREHTILHKAIVAGASRLEAIKSAINRLKASQDPRFQSVQATLEKHQLNNAGISAAISRLSKQAEEKTGGIREIEAELEVLKVKILRDAKVIASSLTKATISKQMDDQKFDVVVVDEASMSPLPNLYFVASRSTQKAIVVGDFRQLPPIVQAGTPMAKQWLGRDIFNQARIQRAVDERKPEPRLTMLRRQNRMHPDISRVANDIIYDGQLVDSLGTEALQEINAFLEISPFAKTPLVLFDVSSVDPWSCRLDTHGRYNLYSAALSAELARRAARAGIESVGVISPYSLHARLVKMMLDDSGDEKLRHLKVSTVHRFQGLEQDLIIYDVAEGPPVDPWFAKDQGLGSDAAKLINVAITRPRAQLAIVANVDYLKKSISNSDSIILRVLEEIRQRGTVVDSQQVLTDYFCDEFERWAILLNPKNDRINPDESTLHNERNFYAAFFSDLRNSIREIIIVSPFLSTKRARQFLNIFRSKIAEGIKVRVFKRTPTGMPINIVAQGDQVIAELERVGVEVIQRPGLHQKFAFIDRKVGWEGSLNILSQSDGRSTEHMRRLPFPKTCEKLIELHNLD